MTLEAYYSHRRSMMWDIFSEYLDDEEFDAEAIYKDMGNILKREEVLTADRLDKIRQVRFLMGYPD